MAGIVKKITSNSLENISNLSLEELEEVIVYSADKYYNTSKSIISDTIYDLLIDYLRLRNPKSNVLKQIGAKVKSKNKVKLDYFLGSMDKIKPDNPSYLDSWKKKYKAPYLLSDKLDGVSALLTYDNNNNIKLYTRGTSEEGQDISNLIKYLNVPSYDVIKTFVNSKKIKTENENNIIALRGELIIKSQIFDKNWSSTLKNARNSVSGLVNSKKINPDLAKNTDLVLYEIVDPFYTYSEQFKLIEEMGFNVVKYKKVNEISFESLSSYLLERRQNSDYKVDGIIVTNNVLHKRSVDSNPDYAFAYKDVLEDQKAITKIKEIEWNVSKNGSIIPTVIIEPVDIGGVEINRVTGSNARNIVDSGLGKNAIIEVIRSGDVIPKIQQVIKSVEPTLPKGKWHWNETKVHIVSDDMDSDAISIKTIYSFFSTVETKGMGEANVTKIYNSGYNTIEKIVKIKKEDLLKIDGFKEKSADNLIKAIKDSLSDMELATFMTASNILGDNIGIKRIQQILDVYPNILTNYSKWSKNEFIEKIKEVDGWNENAEIFVSNFSNFIKFYDKMNKYISFKKKEKIKDSKLSGLTIVLSGFRDSELQNTLENFGVRIINSISKNVDYLVVKDKTTLDEMTGKVKKALELNIKVITKEELKKLY